MKTFLLTVIILFSFAALINAQQTSIFNKGGEAIAYIDYNSDATIFMWDGSPVAFLVKDISNICVIGFNGSFMGWYENGIIYDEAGYAVGAINGATNMVTQIEPIKSLQHLSSIRPITPIAPIRPIWQNSWSSTSLTEFLYHGNI